MELTWDGKKDKKKPAATCFPGTHPVSSALRSLTSVFGMGTGMASAPWLPACIRSMPAPALGGTGACARGGYAVGERAPHGGTAIWPSLAAY